MPEREIIDIETLDRLIEWGGPRLRQQMMELFLEHSPERMEQIQNGLAASDPKLVELGSHSLKSAAGNVGAHVLQALAQRVEDAASQEDMALVKELMPEFESAFSEARAALEELKGEDEE